MAKLAVVQFSSGEITPEVDARKDIEAYIGGCRRLENMIPDIYGNASKRPGTELVVAGNGAACYYEASSPDPAKIGISTMEELAKIGNDGGFPLNGDYELLNNLDATGVTFWPIGLDAVTHIGASFTGTFDGGFYTISNMTIGTDITDSGGASNTSGLFWKLDGAVIENLTLSNWTIIGPATNSKNFQAGLLCGSSLVGVSGEITNVHVQGSISAHRLLTVGGLGGQINHNMSIISADVDITANGNRCSDVGGLVGNCGSATIDNVYAQGSITSVPAMINVGGLIGQGSPAVQAMTNSYSAVVITGTISSAVGGLVGWTADVTPDYTSCFWDDEIIPVLDLNDIGDEGDDAGITKSNTSPMQVQGTYTGWDFDDIWQIKENDYPRFQWQSIADIREICKRL